MRMTLEGKITLTYSPPDFDQAFWDSHPNLVQIKELLGLTDDAASGDDDDGDVEDWSEGESDGEARDDGQKDDESQDEGAAVPISRNKFDLLVDEDE